jgi:thiol:disulfide interchange protein DsbA
MKSTSKFRKINHVATKAITVLFVSLLSISMSASAAKYTEGEQYTKVSEKATSKPEVREYFSFYCPHCLKFEPLMEDVHQKLPQGVKFERNHVDFLRAASPTIQQLLSKAVVVADQMGMQKKLMSAVFNYIQVQRAVITSEKDIRNIFVLNGANGEEFDKLMASFSVISKANLMKKNQTKFSEKRALTGVPTLFVNGKYRINFQKLDKNNFEQDLHDLVAYLLTLDK